MVENEKLKEENKKLKENNDVQIRMWKVCLDKQDKMETRKSKNKGMKKSEEELIDEKMDEKKELYEVRKERGFKKKDIREERDQNGEIKKEKRYSVISGTMVNVNTEIQSAGIYIKSRQNADMVENANLEDVCSIIQREKIGTGMTESRIVIRI